MHDVISGQRRKIRVGRLVPRPFGGPVRLSSASKQRVEKESAQEDAKKRFPILEAELDRIAKRLKQARLSGKRFAYKKPLRDLYEMAYRWDKKGTFEARIGHVANLRGISVRTNANDFSVLVKAVLGGHADRKTVSRWSVQLKKAMDGDVAPSDLIEHI
jgi:hypothetical protein